MRTFCSEYGGRIVSVHPGPAEDGGDVFDLVVPDVISGSKVQDRYDRATFDRQNAIENEKIEFIALEHPLVRSMIRFCRDTERAGGQTAIKTGGSDLETGGLPASKASEYSIVERIIQTSEELLDRAETEAWQAIEDLADDARKERNARSASSANTRCVTSRAD